MPRDDEKLLRRLSLVSYLLAQHRPVTPAEVHRSVEGYALMTDQAFTRRFYEDRDDLERAGIRIESATADQGGEAYYLPEENYRLPEVSFTPQELAALSVALTLLEGRFAYARLLRLALASLTHGHPDPTQDEVERVAVALAPDEEAELLGAALARLDDAIARGKTVTFSYLAAEADAPADRVLDPYALVRVGGHWYVVGRDHSRDDTRMFRLSRIQGSVQFAGKRPRDFTIPQGFDPAAHRTRAPWQLGAAEGEATVLVADDLAWWVQRSYASFSAVQVRSDGSVAFTTEYADAEALVRWVLGLGARATLLGPPHLRAHLREALATVRDKHCRAAAADGPHPTTSTGFSGPLGADPSPGAADHRAGPPRPRRDAAAQDAAEAGAAAIPPERLDRVLGLLYYLLDEDRGDLVTLSDIQHDLGLSRKETEDDLRLLNLVNHGGGTYLLYAEIVGDDVRVDREPEGELLAHPARLSPLIARALLLALELVGDVLPIDGQRSLASAREKVERLVAESPAPGAVSLHDLVPADHSVTAVINQALRERTLLDIEYYTSTREELVARRVEPYLLFHSGDSWYLEAYCLRAEAQRTFRLDRIRSAVPTDLHFEARPDIDLSALRSGAPATAGRGTRWAVVGFPPAWHRRLVEQGLDARVEDEATLARIPYLDERWLVREIMRYGGAAVLLEPAELRREVVGMVTALLERYAED